MWDAVLTTQLTPLRPWMLYRPWLYRKMKSSIFSGRISWKKTQMACIDPYYGGLWKAEILHQAEKSPVSAYTYDKICVI